MQGHLVNLSPEVEQQQFRLLELCEHFLGLVDFILEVDAAVVEALGLVEGRVVECTPQGAGRLPPQHLGSRLTLGFYFHDQLRHTTANPTAELDNAATIILGKSIKMMQMGTIECDSFDEEDIDDLEAELAQAEGPSLGELLQAHTSPIAPILHSQQLRNLATQQNKDIKLIGNQSDSAFRAFLLTLLLLGTEQQKHYPHLNTLIKEQFFKPNIFNPHPAHQYLDKCLEYFDEVSEGVRPQEFIERQPMFEEGCLAMLKNSVDQLDLTPVLAQLSRKFNIEAGPMQLEKGGQCLRLGSGREYLIVKEQDLYLTVVPDSRDEQSKAEGESIRSDSSSPFMAEASQNSTPKFRNSEVKFRKKSHKNSFGGDMEIVQYRDLLHIHRQRLQKARQLDEYFAQSQLESCTDGQREMLRDSRKDSKKDSLKESKMVKKTSFQQIVQGHMGMTEMKGSTTIHPTYHAEHRAARKISASEIIHPNDLLQSFKKEPSPPHQDTNSEKTDKESAKMNKSRVQKELERIEERQSSQKESSKMEDINDLPQQLLQGESVAKQKDRKYSYFTQQMASTNSKRHRDIDGSNYVFKLPKNQHKNSQVIMNNTPQSQAIRRRFQENPLRFSQLADPSDDSRSYVAPKIQKAPAKLTLNSGVMDYMVKFEPNAWVKKEVIYHMANQQKQVYVFERSFGPVQSSSSLSEPQPCRYCSPGMKQSFTSLFSQNRTKDCLTVTELPEKSLPSYNPYALNQRSFMKNRVHSQNNLLLQTRPSIEREPTMGHSHSAKTIEPKQVFQPTSISPTFSPQASRVPRISFQYQNAGQTRVSPSGSSNSFNSISAKTPSSHSRTGAFPPQRIS